MFERWLALVRPWTCGSQGRSVSSQEMHHSFRSKGQGGSARRQPAAELGSPLQKANLLRPWSGGTRSQNHARILLSMPPSLVPVVVAWASNDTHPDKLQGRTVQEPLGTERGKVQSTGIARANLSLLWIIRKALPTGSFRTGPPGLTLTITPQAMPNINFLQRAWEARMTGAHNCSEFNLEQNSPTHGRAWLDL